MFHLTSTNKKKTDNEYLDIPYYLNEKWLNLYQNKLKNMVNEYKRSYTVYKRGIKIKRFTSPLNTVNSNAQNMNVLYSDKKKKEPIIFPCVKNKNYILMNEDNKNIYKPEDDNLDDSYICNSFFSKQLNDLQKCKMETMFPNFKNMEPRFNRTYNLSNWHKYKMLNIGSDDEKGIQTFYGKDLKRNKNNTKEMKEKYMNYISKKSLENYRKYYY